MTAALLDRLTHRCHIFEMNGESYRFRESMKSKADTRGPQQRAGGFGRADGVVWADAGQGEDLDPLGRGGRPGIVVDGRCQTQDAGSASEQLAQ